MKTAIHLALLLSLTIITPLGAGQADPNPEEKRPAFRFVALSMKTSDEENWMIEGEMFGPEQFQVMMSLMQQSSLRNDEGERKGIALKMHVGGEEHFWIQNVRFGEAQIHAIVRAFKPALRKVIVTTDGRPTPDAVMPALTVLGSHGIDHVEYRKRTLEDLTVGKGGSPNPEQE